MSFVVDASIAAAWFLPDEYSEEAHQLMSRPACAPSLFWFETRNLFLVAERRLRVPSGAAALCMARLRRLNIEDCGIGNDQLVLALAARHALSAYDASYLALAIEGGMPLATTDKKLVAAANAEGARVIR